ncbi:MAG: hypothetical protein JWN34_3127 [Bryobacterales bacterium]|nr:hypothetical protein [Bryobacterales bacterium]
MAPARPHRGTRLKRTLAAIGRLARSGQAHCFATLGAISLAESYSPVQGLLKFPAMSRIAVLCRCPAAG